jgi:hypothetical protein
LGRKEALNFHTQAEQRSALKNGRTNSGANTAIAGRRPP